MSVVLFRCTKCGSYSTSAIVNIPMSARLDASRGVLRLSDVSLPEGDIPLGSVVESHCDECDGLTELVMLDECPHWWESHCCDADVRVCIYCGEEQEGRVIFDE